MVLIYSSFGLGLEQIRTGDVDFKNGESFWIDVFEILEDAFLYSFCVVTGCCHDWKGCGFKQPTSELETNTSACWTD